ncbi:MAG: hypothetical protein Q8Q07_06250 [Dehalococcoidales bacterium]|nr:hypothetical protein [Dehalococcoidales bacterium]
MDFGNIGENAPIILLVIALIFLQIFLRRGLRPRMVPQDIVHGLLSEVRLNLAMAESFNARTKLKKFETVNWQRHQGRVDFLNKSLQANLSDSYTLIGELNQQIAAAKKHKSVNYMATISPDKLKELLSRSRQGLEEWSLANVGTKEPAARPPNIMDDWLGRG